VGCIGYYLSPGSRRSNWRSTSLRVSSGFIRQISACRIGRAGEPKSPRTRPSCDIPPRHLRTPMSESVTYFWNKLLPMNQERHERVSMRAFGLAATRVRTPDAAAGGSCWSLPAGLLLLLSACGNLFEDNGTHLAYTLEKGVAQLRASAEPELVVRYQTLDGGADPYYIEITPSFVAGGSSNIPGSYLVVSGKTRGGTSYHNRFVLVPQRLYIEKSAGGPAELVLRRDGGSVNVVELR
jgi:hypothetical protein